MLLFIHVQLHTQVVTNYIIIANDSTIIQLFILSFVYLFFYRDMFVILLIFAGV